MMFKAAFVAAAAAALVGGASAGHVQHRHVHDLFKAAKRDSNDSATCVPGCTTIYSTVTGTAALWTPSSVPGSSTTAPLPTTTSTTPIVVPTPIVQTCPTPGTYTFPATTVVVTETTTVCGATTTTVPSGTHTLGGVTTVVTTATTVVCPYATTTTNSAGVTTSIIKTTTYVCPSAGTYTIAPVTTTVTKTVDVVVVPVVTTYCPGTYTAPAVVTTVTETDVIVVCPFTSPAAPTTVPTTVPTVAPVPVQSTQQASAPAPKPTSPAVGSGGKTWGMTYTPYDSAGACKDAGAVMTDIAAIKAAGFTTVRVYSTDCNTLPNVGAACQANGLKMIVGVFVGQVGCDNSSPHVSEQIDALKSWAQWDLVELAVIGNEAVFNGFCTVQQLTDLIVHVKAELASTGYSGPCTTTEVVSTWIGNDMSGVCAVVDVAGINAHAYFNSAIAPEGAGVFVAGQLAIVEGVCGGKSGVVLESGWPSGGKGNAGPQQQETALISIKETCGEKVIFFSFTNDMWKDKGDCECEQRWGSIDVFGTS